MAESSSDQVAENPRCPKCGYALVGLPEFRCPECGTPFEPDYIVDSAARTHLLQWERPEAGRRLGRLGRTILHASLRPGRFFAAVGQRKDRLIVRAGSLVAACAIVSLCFHATAFLLDGIVFFIGRTWRHVAPQQALHATLSLLRIRAPSEWFMPTKQVLTMLLSIFLVAVLMARVFRRRSGVLRDMDLVAILSPAIVLGAIIAAATQVVLAIAGPGLIDIMVWGQTWAQTAVLLLLVWHCCRRLLALSLPMTVVMLVVCSLLQYGTAEAVSYMLSSLMLLILT